MLKLNITLSFISFSIQKFRGKSNKTLTKISNFFFFTHEYHSEHTPCWTAPAPIHSLICYWTASYASCFSHVYWSRACSVWLQSPHSQSQSLFRLIAITSFAVIGRIRFEKSSTVSDSAIFLKSQKLSEFYK